MVYSMEALEAFASTMKTDMTVKAPQDFAAIVIQNAEEQLSQHLSPSVKLLTALNLLVLNKNVLVLIFVSVNLTVNLVDVFVLVDSEISALVECDICCLGHSLLHTNYLFKYLCSNYLISINTDFSSINISLIEGATMPMAIATLYINQIFLD